MNEDFAADDVVERPEGSVDQAAVDAVRRYFEERREQVVFSRQVEIYHESTWFHWITNRAIKTLVSTGEIKHERRPLATGGTIHLLWHRGYRYYKRDAARLRSE